MIMKTLQSIILNLGLTLALVSRCNDGQSSWHTGMNPHDYFDTLDNQVAPRGVFSASDPRSHGEVWIDDCD